MNAIRIRKKLNSDMLHLPELRPMLGHTVDIIVLEEGPVVNIRPGTGDWATFERLAREIKHYDFDAQREQDEVDRRHAQDHLP